MPDFAAENATPESMLRFPVEKLSAAGVSLGVIESAMASPQTTFEDLYIRAERIDRANAARERAALLRLRFTGLLLVTVGAGVIVETLLRRRK